MDETLDRGFCCRCLHGGSGAFGDRYRGHEGCLAGSPSKLTQQIAGKLIPNVKGFVGKYNPDINSFFTQRVTVNAGDTVSFRLNGFHTIDLPGKSKTDLPLIMPQSTTATGNDAAGNPFWWSGKLPNIGLNPAVVARRGFKTYDGTKRIESGLPAGNRPPKPLNVKFNKPGVYKYFCDVHPGMVGFVVVKPKGTRIPSARQVHTSLVNQITGDVKTAKKLAKARQPANTSTLGSPPGTVSSSTRCSRRP